MKRIEDSLRDLWDNIKGTNIRIIGIQEERWNKILNFQKKMMSSKIELSDDVNNSEQTTNGHNKAIAWLLYSANNMYCDPMEACEVYTRQCSTLVSAEDLATMAATLANKGINQIGRASCRERVSSPV